MQKVEFEAVLPLSCKDAFNLAADLPGYADFLSMLKNVDILEQTKTSARARFKFDLDGPIGVLARTISPVKMDQIARITWKNGREITGESIEGPLKSIFMCCHLTPETADRTKANVEISFESGKGWLVDKAIKFFLQNQGNNLLRSLDSELAAGLEKRRLRTMGLISP